MAAQELELIADAAFEMHAEIRLEVADGVATYLAMRAQPAHGFLG